MKRSSNFQKAEEASGQRSVSEDRVGSAGQNKRHPFAPTCSEGTLRRPSLRFRNRTTGFVTANPLESQQEWAERSLRGIFGFLVEESPGSIGHGGG